MNRAIKAIISGALMGLAFEYIIVPYITKPIDELTEKVVSNAQSN